MIVRLLVTRPDPDGARTATALRERGHEVTVAALLRLEHIAFELPDEPLGYGIRSSAGHS